MPVQHFGALLDDSKKLIRHILTVMGVSFIIAAVLGFFFDQKIALYFGQDDVRAIYWQFARDVTNIGLSEHYFAIALGTWAFCAWIAPRMKVFAKGPKEIDYFRRWGLNFFVALIVCGIMTHFFKFFVGRQRPHMTPDFEPFTFNPMTTHWDYHSFSSGHSQVMWTVATMFAVAFPKFRWLWVLCAISICSTRAIIHDHFLSDIIFGSCLGYVGSLLAMKIMKEKTRNGLY